MKVYLDLIIFVNFFFDFLLLFAVAMMLKRPIKLGRMVFASGVGSVTILSLFYAFSSVGLFGFKIIISLFMVVIAFGFNDFKYLLKNLFYLYVVSVFLGGGLYLLNIQFSYKSNGLIFYHQGLSINMLAILLLTPIIIYFYVQQNRNLKTNYANYYKVVIYFKNKEVIEATAFLDTGNRLRDPYRNRPIILVDKRLMAKVDWDNVLLVPYHSLNNHNLLKCVVAEKIYIENVGYKKNFLVGVSNEKFAIDGVDCILNGSLLERMN